MSTKKSKQKNGNSTCSFTVQTSNVNFVKTASKRYTIFKIVRGWLDLLVQLRTIKSIDDPNKPFPYNISQSYYVRKIFKLWLVAKDLVRRNIREYYQIHF